MVTDIHIIFIFQMLKKEAEQLAAKAALEKQAKIEQEVI